MWGSWANEWCPEALAATLAASQGHFSISPADAVSIQDAILFLIREEAAWNGRVHPRGPFRADITSGVSARSQQHFHWPYFVQGREWYGRLFVPEGWYRWYIDSWEVAWSNCGPRGYAVFVGRRTDGWMFRVDPRARTQAEEFSWDTDNIAEMI